MYIYILCIPTRAFKHFYLVTYACSLFVEQNRRTMSRPKYTQKSINVEGHFYANIIF